MRDALTHCRTAVLNHEDGDAVSTSFRFPPTFIGFAGHFPDNPILPAIVQILAAQTVVDEWVGGRTALYAVTAAKFLETVVPDQPLDLRASRKREGVYSITLHRSNGDTISKFVLECR